MRCKSGIFTSFTFFKRNISAHTNLIDLSEEVRFALQDKKAVVALESTIITHGMPYPGNLECATDVENIVRQQGAVPATIAILGGRIKVGLDKIEIAKLADTTHSSPIKTSRRDFGYVISKKSNGGTTVSGTLIIAEKVGIRVFVTGGIGGVHRQAEHTFDISADLTELGRVSVAVVSSGVKSILDIPKTLEYLETRGVYVCTFGKNKDFPAFYCTYSGSEAPYNVTNAKEAADIVRCNLKLGLNSGLLFAVPVPEECALDDKLIKVAIDEALRSASREGISGKHITPYVLDRVSKITKGLSLVANMALIKNNAKVGADIAVELAALEFQE